ncbi:MAG: RHS repeat-associated core domain-containing protein [Planctomycetota bacterium]
MYRPSPHTGRWLSEDPIGFEAGDGNLYRYVINSVTSYADPTGLYANEVHTGDRFDADPVMVPTC